MIPTPDMLPDPSGPNSPHWQSALRGELVVQRCVHCGALRFPAAPLCAACNRTGHDWQAVRPTGRIRSWCRFHRGYFPGAKEQLPYTVLLVELDDGLCLYSNPAEEYPLGTQPAIGQAVSAVFQKVSDNIALVRFAPLPPA